MASKFQSDLDKDVREAARARASALSKGDSSGAWAVPYVDTAAEHGLTLEQFKQRVVDYNDAPDLDVIAAELQRSGVKLG